MSVREANLQRAKTKAISLIKTHPIGLGPTNLQEIASSEGLSLEIAEFKEPNISGFVDLEKKAILVNKNDSSAHQRLTIAHELGHWFLHREELEDDKDIVVLYSKSLREQEDDVLEQEATYFAACLLIPPHFETLLGGSLTDYELAGFFRVPEELVNFKRKNP